MCNIRTISNQYLITCSNVKNIIKTDIKKKTDIYIYISLAIDYNDRDNILLVGSHDKYLKLWDCNLKTVIINKE